MSHTDQWSVYQPMFGCKCLTLRQPAWKVGTTRSAAATMLPLQAKCMPKYLKESVLASWSSPYLDVGNWSQHGN
eukprot:1141829-Pelagomonas_calceolata.AAC.3